MRTHYIITILFVYFSCSNGMQEKAMTPETTATIKTKKRTFYSGDTINLKFEINASNENSNVTLLLTNAFGSSIIMPKVNNKELTFPIPEGFCQKAGPCAWTLIKGGNTLLLGKFTILPKTKDKPTIETYFGPRSITAGEMDYSMLISVTTDIYDNVFPEGTALTFKSQFLDKVSETKVLSKDLISWKNISTTKKSGRILVSTSIKNVNSKELTTIIFPSLAESFKIKAKRNHTYADGNQIVNLSTDVIKDQYGNIISDGTIVTFKIENKKGAFLNTKAPTINGISKATILHPAEPEAWKITAFVTGAAASNTINIKFKRAIEDFNVKFSSGNRIINIGPFNSFMGQLIPDGILVQLNIYDSNGKYIETKKTTSIKGFAKIELPKEYYINGNYHFMIKAVGLIKEYDIKLYEK